MSAKWTRKFSSSMGGLSEQDFCTGLLAALSNVQIVEKLCAVLNRDLITEIQHLRSVIIKKEEKITDLDKRVVSLEKQVDDLEQYSRRNSVRISGLPEYPNTDPSDVTLYLLNKTMGITPPVQYTDLDRVHRVGKPRSTGPRGMLVKFATYRSRQRVFAARDSLRSGGRRSDQPWQVPLQTSITDGRQPVPPVNPAGESGHDPAQWPPPGANEQPTTGEGTQSADDGPGDATELEPLNIVTTWSPPDDKLEPVDPMHRAVQTIFISEDLTKKRADLLFEARQARRGQKIAGSWSYDGTVKIKTNAGLITDIHTLVDLQVITGEQSEQSEG